MTNNFNLQVDHKIALSLENKATVLQKKKHRILNKSKKLEMKTSQNGAVKSVNKAVSTFALSSVQDKTTSNSVSGSVQQSSKKQYSFTEYKLLFISFFKFL